MALWSLQQSQQVKDWKTQECPSQRYERCQPAFCWREQPSVPPLLHPGDEPMSWFLPIPSLMAALGAWTRSFLIPQVQFQTHFQKALPRHLCQKAAMQSGNTSVLINKASQRVQPGFLSLALSLSTFPQTIFVLFLHSSVVRWAP